MRNKWRNKQYGFICNSDRVDCDECGFEAKVTLWISHIQFIHELLSPKCKMVNNIDIEYHNYSVYSAHWQSVKCKKYILEIGDIMVKTLIKALKWPRCLSNIDQLVPARLF